MNQTDTQRIEKYSMDAAPIRAAINSRPLTDFYMLTQSRKASSGSAKMYDCPICRSGEKGNKTGALQVGQLRGAWRVTCYAGRCFGEKGQDTLGALRKLMPDKSEREIFAYCGYQAGSAQSATKPAAITPPSEPKQQEAAPMQAEPHNFKADIDRFAAALAGSAGESYLIGRGLTRETMTRFKLGFDAQRQAVTIPYNQNGSYYGRRSVKPDAEHKHDNLKGVSIPLFNAGALYAADTCFVVESPLCAISITQAGGAAVAISGTSGQGRLVDALKKKPTGAALILCLDNDPAGRKATESIGAALDEMGIFCLNGCTAIMGEAAEGQEGYRKDPNEVLQRSGAEALHQAVKEAIEEAQRQHGMTAQEAEAERQQQTGAGMVAAFLDSVQTRRYEPIPTGIADIDHVLNGGFMRQQLILLGAAPGAGKTALAAWIFEGMARRGISCVYLNLEMSRDQMLARSFSRMTAVNGQRINATRILQGYRWTDEERKAIYAAAGEYARDIAPYMQYNPDGVTANLDSILAYIEAEAQRAEQAGLKAPCIVLDYLQIVGGNPGEDSAAIIKRAVSSLKTFAVNHNSFVFVIMAHNRMANRTGEVSMEAGRDTSALEYSADLQLALTYTLCLKRVGQTQKTKDELTPEEKKWVTLKVTKGRFGGADTEVDLCFNGETMTYTQIANGFTPVNEPTPFDEPQQQKLRF